MKRRSVQNSWRNWRGCVLRTQQRSLAVQHRGSQSGDGLTRASEFVESSATRRSSSFLRKQSADASVFLAAPLTMPATPGSCWPHSEAPCRPAAESALPHQRLAQHRPPQDEQRPEYWRPCRCRRGRGWKRPPLLPRTLRCCSSAEGRESPPRRRSRRRTGQARVDKTRTRRDKQNVSGVRLAVVN